MSESIDLTPSPRVLRMLGEIDFKAWQCLCEIIDNSIDAFNSSSSTLEPSIKIKLPGPSQNQITPTDQLVIEDNADGMGYEDLSKSLKAGFSANSPIDKMGLFGMGFNISTARLGYRTEVITSTKESNEFLTVTIDFQELEEKRHFDAPVKRIPKKVDEIGKHGTKIIVTKLRTDHIRPLYQRKKITKKLGKIYGRVIREKKIKLNYAGSPCNPVKHCVWSAQRQGQTKEGPVPAIIDIDHLLDSKKYCSTCWVWLDENESCCPACSESSAVTTRDRRIKGWIGIQRYFHAEHYGIDLIRNGRVVVELDKSFFSWLNTDEELELEYPVDGHSRLGRIVGELEVDFLKVTHTKDAFDQNTIAWKEVVTAIRGGGPIRPNIAKSHGYSVNTSPLARLFSAFRLAKAGITNLVPQRRNGQAMITDGHIDELRRQFEDGISDYQSDEKWWELVTEVNSPDDPDDKPYDPTGGNPFGPDEIEPEGPSEVEIDPAVDRPSGRAVLPELKTEPDLQLSNNYSLDFFKNVSIRVVAQKAVEGSHENGFTVAIKGVELQFTYWPYSPEFENTLLTPADFLINELAYHMHLITHNELSRVPLTVFELALREKYFPDLFPTIDELRRQVRVFKEDLVDHLRSKIGEFDFNILDIDDSQLSLIKKKIAQNESLDDSQVGEAIKRGEFMSYAPLSVLRYIICKHPKLVFDGKFFRQKWPASNDPSSIMDSLTIELESLLMDVEWFADSSSSSGRDLWRAKARRLVGSLEILLNWRV